MATSTAVRWTTVATVTPSRLSRIGKEISRFEQGKDDFIENIDAACIRYDGGRAAANKQLIAEIRVQGLRKTTRQTGLDRKTIRAILNGKKTKASTLAVLSAYPTTSEG